MPPGECPGTTPTAHLSSSPSQSQLAALKLDDLSEALCRNGYDRGGRLSSVRNEINYRHQRGCWHPYDYRRQYADRLHGILPKWKQHADILDLSPSKPADPIYFLTTCVFLVALRRELVEEILDRRTVPHVFVQDGCIKLLSLIA